MSERNRKIRGQQIRSSRAEKGSAGRESGSSRDPDGGGLAEWADEFGDGPFVETDAVDAVRERVQRWLTADRPVHLIGPTGCGKTALAMRVARDRGRPVVFINGDAELTTADLVGEYAETERESVRDRYVHNVMKSKDIVRDRWVDNPLTVAVREGATLVYNEFSRTEPAANNVLLSVFEEGVLELPGRRGGARYVDVHPEFRTILTSNSVEYAGIHTPQDALLDRLVGIHMEFYDRETERAIVGQHVDAPEATLDRVVDTMRAVREADPIDATVGTRAMIMAAEGMAAATERMAATEGVAGGDDGLLEQVCVDALASKVPDSEGLAALREAVARAAGST